LGNLRSKNILQPHQSFDVGKRPLIGLREILDLRQQANVLIEAVNGHAE
jgi:hypothetical protein